MVQRVSASRRRPATPASPPVRLRYLLAIVVAGWGGVSLARQARAAFDLHDAAAKAANYALCMVGPTGPKLLREGADEYARLLERRVVAAGPKDRPFARCAALGEKVGLSRALHELEASAFREYFDGSAGDHEVSELAFDRSKLDELAGSAGLFAPASLEALIIPERHAEEASHPREPVRPAVGRGLPPQRSLYRSAVSYGDTWVVETGSGANAERLISHNRGLHFERVSGRAEPGPSGPCAPSPEGVGFSIILSEADETVLVSRNAAGSSRMTKLAARHERVEAADCDGSGFLALLDDRKSKARRLKACSLEGVCVEVPLPTLGERPLPSELDVAWVGGDIVLAASEGRLTRVTTSRDRGQTWTPWVLAFDGRELLPAASRAAPRRLLHVDDEVLLHGVSERGQPYLVLASHDHGASFSASLKSADLDEEEKLVRRE